MAKMSISPLTDINLLNIFNENIDSHQDDLQNRDGLCEYIEVAYTKADNDNEEIDRLYEPLRKDEFNENALALAKASNILPEYYESFIEDAQHLRARYKAAAKTSALALDEAADKSLILPSQADVLYVNRPDRKMDPISFLRIQWGRYMDAGLLYQDDLVNRLDPQLIPNVRSYCQRMAKKHPDRAAEFVAMDHLPPVRPKEVIRDPAIAAEPGTVEYELLKRKADSRARKAKSRKKQREAALNLDP